MANKKGRPRKGNAPSRKFTSMVKKVVDKAAEQKYKETVGNTLNFDAAPALSTLVKSLDQDLIGPIVQGVASNHRIGDRIKMSQLDFRAVFIPTAAAKGGARIIIGQLLDQANFATMTLSQGEVLAQSIVAKAYSPLTSGYDHEPLVKYKLLMDEVITWDAQNVGAPRLISKRFRNLGVRVRNYEGSANISTGGFFYMLVTANGVAATLEDPYAKITYTDY